jgi:hypothetical protein
MSRRSTPERLDAARHAAVRKRLIGEARMSEARADEWIARWHERAAQDGRERDGALLGRRVRMDRGSHALDRRDASTRLKTADAIPFVTTPKCPPGARR